jgi:hypothetical protein
MTFSSTWGSASTNPKDQEDAPPPVGTHSVSLDDARAFTSKAGNEVLIATFRVLDGPHEGVKWDVVMGFSSEGAAGVTKSFCQSLGVDVDSVEASSIENLNDALKAHLGTYYGVDVVQKGISFNTYVTGRLDGSAPVSDVPADGAPAHAPASKEDQDEAPW